MAKKLIFYYDVVCPFAYMASRHVEALGKRTGAAVDWKPVLLGGLYEATEAPQGKAGSATQVMSAARMRLVSHDLHRQFRRLGVPYREPTYNPQKTLYAMRLLAAVQDSRIRVMLTHDLYQAYWCHDRDVSDETVLASVSAPLGICAKQLMNSDEGSRVLRANTREAAERGAFGVPGFFINGRLFWGTDRMFMVERTLGLPSAAPERLLASPAQGAAKLTIFFDFSSPWSYLGAARLPQLLKDVAPVQVSVEWVPVLVGALFRSIGTPMVPLTAMPEAKKRYMRQDLQDWTDYAGVDFYWNDTFPLRTVLPLRIAIASGCNPLLIGAMFAAAWRDNKDIGQEEVVCEVIQGVGLDAEKLMKQSCSEPVKKQLFANTTRAAEEGLCGVPSFTVNEGPVVWGQDRLNVVADMICGWADPVASKL